VMAWRCWPRWRTPKRSFSAAMSLDRAVALTVYCVVLLEAIVVPNFLLLIPIVMNGAAFASLLYGARDLRLLSSETDLLPEGGYADSTPELFLEDGRISLGHWKAWRDSAALSVGLRCRPPPTDTPTYHY
jgi:hypothetical protein